MTYSLLLHSIENKPSIKELEEISVAVPAIARADCRHLLDDWFGVVISGVTADTARSFQSALKGKGYPTDIIEDHEIPALHADYRCQRIALSGEKILLTDTMGKTQNRDKGELVFTSAGAVEKNQMVSDYELALETRYTGDGCYTVPVNKRVHNFEKKSYFRFDLFFTSSPNRISLELGKDSVIFYMDRPIRMKNTLELTVLMVDLHALLPPERMNQSLRNLFTDFLYPSMHAYEEELRWAFYRLGAKG